MCSIGGLGKDRLSGDGGNDVFEFFADHSLDAAPDIIGDFTQGEDKIDLSKIDADTNIANDQDFTFIGTDAFSGRPESCVMSRAARQRLFAAT